MRAAVLLLLAQAALGQSCLTCNDQGTVPCRRHTFCARPHLNCSIAADCAGCRGALLGDCTACKRRSSDATKRRALLATWLAERRQRLLQPVLRPGTLGRVEFLDGPDVRLAFAPARLQHCPTADPHAQLHLYFERILAVRRQFLRTLGLAAADLPQPTRSRPTTVAGGTTPEPASPLLHIDVFASARDHQRSCPPLAGLVYQGLSTKRLDTTLRSVIWHDPGRLYDDAALHGLIAHEVSHLLCAAVIKSDAIGNRGHGWLDAGLAHYFESAVVGLAAMNVCYHEHAQPPLTFGSGDAGDWSRGLQELVRQGRLPSLISVFGKDTHALTPEEHLLSFALVRYLISRDNGGPALGSTLRAIKGGASSEVAVEAAFGSSLAELEAGLRRSLTASGGAQGNTTRVRRPAPHLSVYIYTRPHIRARHIEVVRRAIAKRNAAHTSGWRLENGKPRLELGPVDGSVRHWRNGRITNTVGAAWPFAAVVEFDKGTANARPAAHIDWFRRARGSRDPSAWRLDPAGAVKYVRHINDETVGMDDDRYAYMAVVDTPTGDVIGSNEFAVRARVVWGDGSISQAGWWVRFESSRNVAAADWVEQRTPLVPWQIDARDRSRLAIISAPVSEPAHELAVFGTSKVFRFPVVPPGIDAYRPK